MNAFPSLSTLRQTVRRLARERGFTTTALLTLALCVGANVAIFAVVDAILVRSLPYPHADRLVHVLNSYPGAGAERAAASLPNYYERSGNIAAFESISVIQRGRAVVGAAGSPNRVDRDRVSPEFFATLGVPLAMGRTFTEDEMLYANSQRAILTHEYWQNQFSGQSDILGQTMMVDSQSFEIIGVLPPKFRFVDSEARFFIPLASDLEERTPERRHSNNQQMIARLAPGVSLAQAQAQMDAFNEEQIKEDPLAELLRGAGFHTKVLGLHADTVREVRPTLILLQAGVLALLLIGAVNLVNLLLIRTHGRAKEFAVRQALGAGRRQIGHEILTETVLLAVVGGCLGLGAGAFGVRLLMALGTDQLPLGVSIAFDGRLAAISLAASILVGLLLAVPIMVVNWRSRLAPVLQAESRGGTISKAAQTMRYVFIVVQVALAFVLLSGAGLLGISLNKILQTSPGFESSSVLTGSVNLPWQNYREGPDKQQFFTRLLGELRGLPGVSQAALITGLPFGGNHSDNATTVEGVDLAPGESIRTHFTTPVMGDYFAALGIPLVEGRLLTPADQEGDQRVCVVDEEFVRRYWPDGESALGRRIANDVEINDENAMTIVGVVGHTKTNDLVNDRNLGTIYLPYRDSGSRSMFMVLRTEIAPEALANSLQRLVLSLDPELPVDDIQVLQTRIDDTLVARRSPAILGGIFAGVALLLAAVGTYGVLAYAVGQRRREIGVRMALGALPAQVLQQFLRLGMVLLAIGVTIGVLGAWGTGIAMQSVLFDVQPFHPGIVAATAIVLGVVVLIATLLPSHRASQVSPIEALRDD